MELIASEEKPVSVKPIEKNVTNIPGFAKSQQLLDMAQNKESLKSEISARAEEVSARIFNKRTRNA